MTRKLTFYTPPAPQPIKFWQPTKGEAFLRWLPDKEFEKLAIANGFPPSIGAFSVWGGGWWQQSKIYMRATRFDLIVHEVQHIETKSNFHAEDTS